MGTAQWSSYSYGGDVITIPAHEHNVNVTYYIGVFGFSASTFSISVRIRLRARRVPLTLGGPPPSRCRWMRP